MALGETSPPRHSFFSYKPQAVNRIISKGPSVPEEIEAVITEIKGVSEAFVWGNKNDREAIDVCAKLLINRKVIGAELGLTTEPDDSQVDP